MATTDTAAHTTEPIQLSDMERMAAIRAYNSTTKHQLTRAEMVDHIIAAINEERAGLGE